MTASQAQRKWYAKIITKVSSGDYKSVAVSFTLLLSSIHRSFLIRFFVLQNSVNIIVRNRNPDGGATGRGEDASVRGFNFCIRK